MLQKPAVYKTSAVNVQRALTAFFEFMWREQLEDGDASRLRYVVLAHEHEERGMLQVTSSGCDSSFSPLVRSLVAGRQFFIHHPQAQDWLRTKYGHFYAARFPSVIKSAPAFATAINALYGTQLTNTLGALAAGLPIYSVEVVGQLTSVAPRS